MFNKIQLFFRELFSRYDNRYVYLLKLKFIIFINRKHLSRTPLSQPVEDLMNTESMRIIFLSSFDELNVARIKNHRLIYYQEISKKDTIFYVRCRHVCYVYVLSASSFSKNTKGFGLFYDTEDDVPVMLKVLDDVEVLDDTFTGSNKLNTDDDYDYDLI